MHKNCNMYLKVSLLTEVNTFNFAYVRLAKIMYFLPHNRSPTQIMLTFRSRLADRKSSKKHMFGLDGKIDI